MEITNNYNCSFTGKINAKKILPKAIRAFNNTFSNVQSPSKICFFADPDTFCGSQIRHLNKNLKTIRDVIQITGIENGAAERFYGLFKFVKLYNVANGSEFAEIMKTILRLNKVKNCDVFALYAKDNYKNIRRLDHCIVGLNVPKARNNKQICKPFIPPKSVKIIDMWWPNGFVGNPKEAKKLYKVFGLESSETLMLKPLKTFEPNNEAFNAILENMPQLKVR